MVCCQLATVDGLGSLVGALQQLLLVVWAVQELPEGYFRVGCSPECQGLEQLLGQLLGAGPAQQQMCVSLAVGWGKYLHGFWVSSDVNASKAAIRSRPCG